MAPHQRLRMARPVRLLSLPCRASLRCSTGEAVTSVAASRHLPHISDSPRVPSAATLGPSAAAQGLLSTNPGSASTSRRANVRVGHFFPASVTIPSSLSSFSSSSSLPSPLLSIGGLPSQLQQQRSFRTTAAAMVATKLDGNTIAKAIRERLGAEIAEKQKKNPRYHPSLRIIQGTSANAKSVFL